MALILPWGDKRPRVGRDVFLAPNATIIGDVEIGDGASIWFGAVLRGDIGPIRVGARTNVQDLACVHITGGLSSTIVGADVTIGHGAILHGCIVGDRCLIGMGSILLDNCRIGEGSVVAAGAVVTQRLEFPPRSLLRGTPARFIREVDGKEGALGVDGAEHYAEATRRYRALCASLPNGLSLDEVSVAGHDLRPAPPRDERSPEQERGRPLAPGRVRERSLDFGNDRDEGGD
jgi:carbonic anhydrase/acetyltransferase-like protein (isoleucine patch superfamily)